MILTITIRIPVPGTQGPVAAPAAAPEGARLAGGTRPAGPASPFPASPFPISPAAAASMLRLLRALLPLAEPAAMLAADAAGLGLAGQIVCAAAVRSAGKVLAA